MCAPAHCVSGTQTTRHIHLTAAVSEIKCGDSAGIAIPAAKLLLRLSDASLARLSEAQQKTTRASYQKLIEAFKKVYKHVVAIAPTDALENRLMTFSNDDNLVSLQRHNARFGGHNNSSAVEPFGVFLNGALLSVVPDSPEIEVISVSYQNF